MCVCLEVEDEVDKWGPPISEKIYGTQLLEGEREKQGMAARTFCLLALTGRRRMTCHVRKNDKFNIKTSLV